MSTPSFSTNTYERFSKFIEDRINAKPAQHLTEDSVRYSFFCAILETTDIKQHEVILELPHPDDKNFKGKEVDMHVQAPHKLTDDLYIEFKFHRKSGKSNHHSPRPLKAGSLFKDFSRLSSVKNIKEGQGRCFVIYLTDNEMANYFGRSKYKKRYSDFWNPDLGSSFNYDEKFRVGLPKTFVKASEELHEAKIDVIFSRQIGAEHHLRVFEINKIQCA